MIKAKDIKFDDLYNDYCDHVKKVVSIKLYIDKDQRMDVVHDILLNIFNTFQTEKVFENQEHLDKYVNNIIFSSIIDFIRYDTGVRWDSFKLIQKDILDWPALSQLFFYNNGDKKIVWAIKLLTMDDDNRYPLKEDFANAIKTKNAKSKDNRKI